MGRYNKYKVSPKAERTHNGRTYASKAEMEYAKILAEELRIGIHAEVHPQPTIRLGPIDYVPDFAVKSHCGNWWWVDVKGMETPAFKIKLKLWAEYGPGPLIIVKKSGKRFKIKETIQGQRS